ncbi:hypothetical protein R84981_002621 [Carnimonas sp. R-84981]
MGTMNSPSLWASMGQALDVTLPVCLLIALGAVLRWRALIDAAFIATASRLVFTLSMPVMIFFDVLAIHPDAVNPALLIYFAVGTLASLALVWLWGCWRVTAANRATFIQGAFRGNGAVLGLAFATGMYGHYGVSLGALLIAVLIPLYNGLSVVVLSIYSGQRLNVLRIAGKVLRNPLIIGVLAALLWRLAGIGMPRWIASAGNTLGDLTLPLALLCIGGSLSLAELRNSGRETIEATLLKIVILPLLLTFGGWLYGFRHAELGMLFLYFAAPSATAGFVMAKAMGGNGELAASIIAFTTLGAMLTVSIGLSILTLLPG